MSVWSHYGTGSGQNSEPRQLVTDETTQNRFVADYVSKRIQVFDAEGNHLYEISTPPNPIGIALIDEFIFVTTDHNKLLLKIEKSNSKSIKSVQTEYDVWGIESTTQTLMCASIPTNQLLCLIKI